MKRNDSQSRNGRMRGFAARGSCLLAALWLAGCGGHEHGDGHDHHGEHVHVAPHGGALVMLGDHAAQLEFVADEVSGMLEMYVLDGEAEHFIRLVEASFSGEVFAGGRTYPLVLKAVADEATGETAGDTARFTAEAPWLAEHDRFEAVLEAVEIQGRRFGEVRFSYPEGKR